MSALKNIRRLAGKGKRLVRNSRTKVLRRLGVVGGQWRDALPQELQYWEDALKDGGKNWNASEYRERTDTKFELQEELRALIPAAERSTVRILDVGAGPLTRIGKHWPGRSLEIVAVDPLGDQYHMMLKRIGLRPIVPVRTADAEKSSSTSSLIPLTWHMRATALITPMAR